jgi:hypothetical protein
MNKNQLFAAAAAAVVAFLTLIVVMFWRQSSLEDEITTLRGALESQQSAGARPVVAASTPEYSSPGNDASRIGKAEPFLPGDSDPVNDARLRIGELERAVNSQADIIEDLLAEKKRLEEQRRRAAMRAWGPEQATGAPDTMTAGDQHSAWAPAVADGGVEWLQAEFENPADLAKIVVRQTCNPGCITKVVAVTDTGAEVPIWSGQDPSKGKALDDTPFAVPPGIRANRVKVYIDTSKVAGWEEIDAVQMIGRDGSNQWAKSVNASSTYASGANRLGEVTNLESLLDNTSRGGTRF